VKKYFGYVRVSTVRQGEHGVSLQEQREAINKYASRFSLNVCEWFEEQETAAKRGRPIFTKMLRQLKRGVADGMIMHKIDRGARNLRDWADLAELTDQGIEIHFANENLDLQSRGGRLSADIQAVVASDYIRNLREEVLKGFYGRLKQGLYPLPAPLGYVNKGKGKPKTLDPVRAPLVRKAFELYETGRFTHATITAEMDRLGLRNSKGKTITEKRWSVIFNNPFYFGLIHLKGTGETFNGIHQPLISKALYDRVQGILKGRITLVKKRHEILFRRLIKCANCGYSLIGEIQKGHTYYRCQKRDCPTKCIREELIEAEIIRVLSSLQFSEKEKDYLRQKVTSIRSKWETDRAAAISALELQIHQNNDRLNRLTDAYIDRLIDKDIFEERKKALLLEQQGLQEKLSTLGQDDQQISKHINDFLELAGSAYLSYKLKLPDEKREFLRIITSNRQVDGKNVNLMLTSPFDEVLKRRKKAIGGPERDLPRTWDKLLDKIMHWIITEQPYWLMGKTKAL